MTVVVTIFTPADGGGKSSGVGPIRIQERLTIGSSSVNPTRTGEMVVVGSSEAGMIAIAYGSAPDAATVTATPTSSAGMPLGSGQVSLPIVPLPGSLFNAKAVP